MQPQSQEAGPFGAWELADTLFQLVLLSGNRRGRRAGVFIPALILAWHMLAQDGSKQEIIAILYYVADVGWNECRGGRQ